MITKILKNNELSQAFSFVLNIKKRKQKKKKMFKEQKTISLHLQRN